MKDRFDMELRSIMEEESEKIYMADELKKSILDSSKPDFLTRIKSFLNSYVEIPIPVAIGILAIAIMVNIVPAFNIDIDFNKRQVIEIGNSLVYVRDIKDVKDHED